jgi:hypothetical protein
MLLYAIFILPEALTAKRRKDLMEANEATQNYHSGHPHDDEDDEAAFQETEGRVSIFFKRINFFKKLAILLPRKDDNGKGYDYRLFVLAIAFLIYRIGGLYTNDVSLTDLDSDELSSSEQSLLAASPDDNGFLRFFRHPEWYPCRLRDCKQSESILRFPQQAALLIPRSGHTVDGPTSVLDPRGPQQIC